MPPPLRLPMPPCGCPWSPAGAHSPLRAPMDPPLEIIFFIWRLFCYFFHIGGLFLYLGGISVTHFSLWEPFLSYAGPLCYFSSIGGPFSYVFLYIMTILGTFLPCEGLFLCIMIILGTFFIVWGPFCYIFLHLWAFFVLI